MTEQQIFNKVARHLLKQGKKSIDARKVSCLYRGPGGLRCAIGCLIPNRLYSKDIEGEGVNRLPSELLREIGIYAHAQMRLASDLQFVHDSFAPRQWRVNLRNVAKKYSLSSNVVDETKKSKAKR